MISNGVGVLFSFIVDCSKVHCCRGRSDCSLIDFVGRFLLVVVKLVFVVLVVVTAAVDNVAVLGCICFNVALALTIGHTAFVRA